MMPIRFAASVEHTLFGIYHAAVAGSTAALLCPPFGQESIRSHRLYRVLAERLARNGTSVLRFDYFGTGDSMGDDSDADLDGWCADVLAAHRELVRRSGATRVCWVGLRLGGSLAALAARQAPAELWRLALCAPILDGAAYLGALRQRHVELLGSLLGQPPRPRPAWLAARDPQTYTSEALGFALPARLRAQLSTLRLDLQAALPDALDIVWMRDADAQPSLQASSRPGMKVWPMEEGIDWMAGTADNGTLIPAKLMMQIMRSVGDAA